MHQVGELVDPGKQCPSAPEITPPPCAERNLVANPLPFRIALGSLRSSIEYKHKTRVVT
jgi:hypothetical protein